ncbi:hypothetical protein SAMN02745244_03335 [Tessaracoccus bendigoensis DSM 12906]|uniref:Uncharacterized protein n=1 Tax=Tessaracoccus bendigoensis DSM 12906 TaxID=1123357 RepID=A0A1M6MEM3_9ACTN|nr:hypothetical protein [Tessaracoccus bendigoensis]SHJ81925.1 hypothetical protein SAMN02745244_03335 [Tessaracoccus bendigoensis DSM 12906]
MTQPNTPPGGGNQPSPDGSGWQPQQGWQSAQGAQQWQPPSSQQGAGFGQGPAGPQQPGPWQGMQPPYGQPPTGQAIGQPPYGQQFQAPKPSKTPRILIIVGAVLAGIGAVFVALFAFQLSAVIPYAGDLTVIDGPTEVVVSGEEMKVIYATDPNAGCSVTSPGMSTPDLALGMSMHFSLDGVDYDAIGKIGGPGEAEGVYVIECDTPGTVAGPAIDIAAIGLSVVYALVGFGSLAVGGVLLIVGLVLRSAQKKRLRMAQ